MVPNQNSVVFYCKTTTWSCLSGTTCSHVCSRTSSCFGACYRSSSPENPATSSRRFVLQTFIFLPRLDESGISWHQPDLNLRQIWWFGTFPKNYNIGSSITGKVDVVASTSQPKDLILQYLDWRSWPPPHRDFVGLLPSCPYGFLCSRSPTFTWCSRYQTISMNGLH